MRTVYCVFSPLPVGQRGKHRSYGFMLLLIGWDPRTCGTYVKQEGRSRGGVENEEVEQEGDRWLKVEELRRNLFWTSAEKTKDKGHGDSWQKKKKLCVYVGGVVICKRYIWNRTWSFLILVMKQWNLPSGGDFSKQKGDLVGRIYHPPRPWLFP